MRGTGSDRRLEIAAHPHRQARKPIARGDVAQHAEMRGQGPHPPAGCTSGRRPADRPRAPSAIRASASAGSTPAFCGSSPVLTCTKRSGHRPISCASRARVVTSFDRSSVWIASAISIAARALLDCSGPIRCSASPRIVPAKVGPLALRLLHLVLAEDPLPLVQHGAHALQRLDLGHGDQRHAAGRAPGLRFSCGDAGLDLGQGHGGPFHGSCVV